MVVVSTNIRAFPSLFCSNCLIFISSILLCYGYCWWQWKMTIESYTHNRGSDTRTKSESARLLFLLLAIRLGLASRSIKQFQPLFSTFHANRLSGRGGLSVYHFLEPVEPELWQVLWQQQRERIPWQWEIWFEPWMNLNKEMKEQVVCDQRKSCYMDVVCGGPAWSGNLVILRYLCLAHSGDSEWVRLLINNLNRDCFTAVCTIDGTLIKSFLMY